MRRVLTARSRGRGADADAAGRREADRGLPESDARHRRRDADSARGRKEIEESGAGAQDYMPFEGATATMKTAFATALGTGSTRRSTTRSSWRRTR